MFYCSQRKCLFQLPLRQSLKLNRLNFNFRLVFHSIFGFGQIRSKLFSTIKSAWDSKGNIKRCRVPLIKEAEQIAWLQRKLGNAARVEDVHPISERPQYFSGDGKSGKIQTVCFEGVITINDAPALIDLVQQGIGPAKSMGCGLLSLAPL
ncbi:type I-E CRISPR-associated protein Cas6/Cse3/CasE [Escherichia coli]|nr:type I-E CRISPR-associated protein Cas6/Cse3/CasE [Escherichia coli]